MGKHLIRFWTDEIPRNIFFCVLMESALTVWEILLYFYGKILLDLPLAWDWQI